MIRTAALRAVAAVSPILEISDACGRSSGRVIPLRVEFRPRSEAPNAAARSSFGQASFDLTELKPCELSANSTRPTPPRHFGFADAEDYYHRASAMRVIDRVRVPALIITAEDDPFVPSRPSETPKVTGNRYITLELCRARRTLRVRRTSGGRRRWILGRGRHRRFRRRAQRSAGCSQRPVNPRYSTKQPAKFRSLPLFFVFEIDKHVAAGRGLSRDDLGPSRDLVGRVSFVAEPEIRVVGSDRDRRGQPLAVRDTQAPGSRAFSRLEDIVVEPGRMPKFERRRRLWRQVVEKRVEQGEVLLQVRRQLKEQRAQLGDQACRHAAEAVD